MYVSSYYSTPPSFCFPHLCFRRRRGLLEVPNCAVVLFKLFRLLHKNRYTNKKTDNNREGLFISSFCLTY